VREARFASRISAAIALITVCPVASAAQGLGWSGAIEASGTMLFGNSSDRIVAAGVQLGRADSTLRVRTDARLRYADARSESGDRRVTGRALLASLGLDYVPFAAVSPFAFGSLETSVQLRVGRRVSVGAGGKYTFFNHPDGEASVSIALVGERTRALADSADDQTSSRERWSLRARTRRRVGPMKFSHVTFYQPSVADERRFTISSTSTLGIDVTKAIALNATLDLNYDSEARGRGAAKNTDGQLTFGIRTSF